MTVRIDSARRRFLQTSASIPLGLVAVSLVGCNLLPPMVTRTEPDDDAALTWVRIGVEGRVEFLCPRQELGQGASIGLAQIVAEELAVDPGTIAIVRPHTDAIGPVLATVGSDSIRLFAEPLARAAAALRETLRARAARSLAVEASTLREIGGALRAADGRIVSYAELAALAAAGSSVVDADALPGLVLRSLDPRYGRRWVGAPVADADSAAIIAGAALYASDVRLPGMLYGAVLKPLALGAAAAGAEMRVQADAQLFADEPGFEALIRGDDFTGIVARAPGAALRCAEKWRVAQPEELTRIDAATLAAMVDVDHGLRAGELEHVLADDRVDLQSPWDVDLRIDVAATAHAPMEPRCAVARLQDGVMEVWTGTQDAYFARALVAQAIDFEPQRVRIHPMRVGGGFGARAGPLVEPDAARLALATGRAVKVQWSRADEFRFAFHRPPSSHRLRLRADAQGRITDWWHAFRSGHVIFSSAGLGPLLQKATSLIRDPGVARGALAPYAAQRRRVEFEDVRIPLLTGPWRGLGAGPNALAIETAIDLLAKRMSIDPVELRLRNLDRGGRLARCLSRVAERSGWGERGRRGAGATRSREANGQANGEATGWGVACGIYKEASFAAAVARVAVDRVAGGVRVERIWCAHDCGQLINPDRVRAQVEGNLVWAMGMVLFERLAIDAGRIASASFHDYRIVRHQDMPALDVDLIETSDDPPTGAGETAIVTAAAIGNAIADAIGEHPTRFPVMAGDRIDRSDPRRR